MIRVCGFKEGNQEFKVASHWASSSRPLQNEPSCRLTSELLKTFRWICSRLKVIAKQFQVDAESLWQKKANVQESVHYVDVATFSLVYVERRPAFQNNIPPASTDFCLISQCAMRIFIWEPFKVGRKPRLLWCVGRCTARKAGFQDVHTISWYSNTERSQHGCTARKVRPQLNFVLVSNHRSPERSLLQLYWPSI